MMEASSVPPKIMVPQKLVCHPPKDHDKWTSVRTLRTTRGSFPLTKETLPIIDDFVQVQIPFRDASSGNRHT